MCVFGQKKVNFFLSQLFVNYVHKFDFQKNATPLFCFLSNTGKMTEATTALMAGTAETATTIVDMEIVMAAIGIALVDMAETDTTIVAPEIASAVIATAVIAIVVADLAETVTTIVGMGIVIATMIAEVVIVMGIEIGDVTTMTVTRSEARGVTVTADAMQEAILIETRGNRVSK